MGYKLHINQILEWIQKSAICPVNYTNERLPEKAYREAKATYPYSEDTQIEKLAPFMAHHLTELMNNYATPKSIIHLSSMQLKVARYADLPEHMRRDKSDQCIVLRLEMAISDGEAEDEQ